MYFLLGLACGFAGGALVLWLRARWEKQKTDSLRMLGIPDDPSAAQIREIVAELVVECSPCDVKLRVAIERLVRQLVHLRNCNKRMADSPFISAAFRAEQLNRAASYEVVIQFLRMALKGGPLSHEEMYREDIPIPFFTPPRTDRVSS